jgi:hypothetical protein
VLCYTAYYIKKEIKMTTLTIDRNKWLRGDINASYLCDDENNMDALGFYMCQCGIDTDTLCLQVDPLELLYNGDITPDSILPLLKQVEIDDPEYPGLHWNIRPEVSDIMLVNDSPLGATVKLSDSTFLIDSEQTRESILALIFYKLGIVLTFN